jgi:hypothetical protein
VSMFQKAVMPPRRSHRKRPIQERFWAKTHMRPGSSCWWWRGHVQPNGYGQFGDSGTVGYAHRWAYEHFIGPIPVGLHLDHICRNRACVKPAHLEPVTQGENNRRSWAARKQESAS